MARIARGFSKPRFRTGCGRNCMHNQAYLSAGFAMPGVAALLHIKNFTPMFGSILAPLLLGLGSCEIFPFKAPNESLKLTFRLDENNINSGFFKADTESNLTYRVEVRSQDLKKILYKVDSLLPGTETHFSFSNTEAQDVFLLVTSVAMDAAKSYGAGMFQMKFESSVDTFDKDVSKKTQIEPAIYALEHLLKKLNDVTALSRLVAANIGSLGQENRRMLKIVVFSSFLTLGAYLLFNIVQLYYMRSYLNEKKYL